MTVNWLLANQQADPGGSFLRARQYMDDRRYQGEERQYQRDERQRATGLRNALTGAINPQTGEIDYGAARRAYIGAGDVQGAIGVDTAARQQRTQITAQQRENITLGARIVRQVNPTDQTGWDRALAAARSAGVDLTGVPPTFDPNYVQQLLAAADASADPSQGYTLGEGDVRIGANNQVVARGAPARPRYYSVPPGGQLVPEPGAGGPSGPAEVIIENDQGVRMRLNQQSGQWEPVQPGAAPASNVAPDWPVAGGAASVPRTFP